MKRGIYRNVNDAALQPLRAFNQAVIRPLAVSIDALLRGGNAILFGVAYATGQVAEETGLADLVGLPGTKLARDLIGLADVAGIVLGTTTPRAPGPRSMSKSNSMPTKATEPFKDKVKKPKSAEKAPLREDKAGNINLNRIDAGEDVKDVIRAAALASDDFLTQRRGVVTHKQTGELADALGMTPEELAKTKAGTAFTPQQIDAARDILVDSAEDVRRLALKAENGPDIDIINLQEGILRPLAVQESVSGVAAEAARSLNILRKTKKSRLDAEGLAKLLENAGGREAMKEMIKRLREFNSPQQISKYIRESRKATSGDMAVEAWINGLLSGPQTHLVNILSNTLVATSMAIPESLISAAISTLKGAKGADKIYFGEARERLFAIAQGGMEGLRTGWRAFRTEEYSSVHTKLEQPRQKAIPSKTLKLGKREFKVGGKQLRIPGRLLVAMDEFFKSIGYRQELNARAYRIAKSEGLDSQALARRIAELIENPTTEMLEAARHTASYQTFTKQLGVGGRALQTLSNLHPLMKIPLTFVRTPVNIMKYAGERSILAIASQKVRGRWMGKEGSVAQSEQIARLIMGSSIGVAAWTFAVDGRITGAGPKDRTERALLYMTGWQPYSIRIGEMYYSYARLEPIGTLIGVITDGVEIHEHMSKTDTEDYSALVVNAIAENVLSKTWSRGTSDMFEAITDSARYGERYINKLVGTLVPNISAQVARSEDPFLREARTLLDTVKSRIPGLSKTLFPRRDLWGNPITLEGGGGPDLASPIHISRLKEDPAVSELIRLQVFPAPLQRTIQGVDLSDAQYDDFQVYAGAVLKIQLNQLVAVPGWGDTPAYARIDMVEKTVNKTREVARKWMLMRYPKLLKDALQAKMDKYRAEESPVPVD